MSRSIFTALLGLGALGAVLWTTTRAEQQAQPPAEPAVPAVLTTAAGDLTFAADLDIAALPDDAAAERHLVLTVSGPTPSGERSPVDLAVVVDTSGSMEGESKWQNAQRAMEALNQSLSDTDQLALVTFSSFVQTPVGLGAARQTGPLAANLLANMSPGGSTYLSGGLEAGFAALGTADSGRVHRVLLMTDGRANVGTVASEGLQALARSRPGMSVSTIGLGYDYDEAMLAAVADAGGGEYHYVSTATDLGEVYASELRSAGAIASTGTTLNLKFPATVHPARVISWPSTVNGQDITISLGDLSAGQTRTIVIPLAVDAAHTGALFTGGLHGVSPSGSALAAQATLTVPRVAASAVDGYLSADADTRASKALAGEAVDQARAAWNKGDNAGAKARLDWGQGLLNRKAASGTLGAANSADLKQGGAMLQSLGYMDAAEGAKAASTENRKMSR